MRRHLTDLDNQPCIHRNIRHDGFRAGAVVNEAAADHQVDHLHDVSFLMSLPEATFGAAQERRQIAEGLSFSGNSISSKT